MKKLLTLSMTLLILSLGMTEAETSAPSRLSGGIICDTLEDIVNFVEGNDAPTCGKLMSPFVGTHTFLGKYEAEGYTFDIVRYDFLEAVPFISVQYGWWGTPVPVYKPVGSDA